MLEVYVDKSLVMLSCTRYLAKSVYIQPGGDMSNISSALIETLSIMYV